MYILGIFVLILSIYVVFEWYSRMVFISHVYARRNGHGKSWKRAKKHYKTNWSFWERIVWKPIFSEFYERNFKRLGIFSYIHFVFALATIVCFLINEFRFPCRIVWQPVFSIYFVFSVFRYLHTNAVATNTKR